MPDYSYDVFVSHSDADATWVQDDLVPRLEAANLKVFVPSRDLEAGSMKIDTRPDAMLRSRKILLILSPSYVASMWGGFESAFIQNENPNNNLQRFLPILKDACEVPARLRIFQVLDLVDPDTMSDPWSKLYGAIEAPTPSIIEILGDQIPPPTTLPPRSRMPFAPNPQFVGRENELRQLVHVLHPGTTAAIGQVGKKMLAASGLGGIGKTQLASEFVHRYGQFYYGGVHWLSFADPASVPAEIAECALALNPKLADRPLEELLQVVKAIWEGNTPRLLVFDNCEDEALLERYRPKTGKCSVLITSRRATWTEYLGVQSLSLGVLPKNESVKLLRSYKLDDNATDAELEAIADELGHLPLALHLAGSFLCKYSKQVTPTAYLERVKKPNPLADRSLQGMGSSPTGHDLSVARTFAVSCERLDKSDETDVLAQRLLARAALFAPGELLPEWLLLMTLDLDGGDTDVELFAQDALTRLLDLGLIEREGKDALRLHRLVAGFVHSVSEDQGAQEAVEKIMLDVANDLNRRGFPAPLRDLQPHLRAITIRAQGRDDLISADLCNSLAYHLYMLGDYGMARPLFEEAFRIHQQVLGSDHPKTAQTINNLAALEQSVGNYAAAHPLLEQAFRITEAALGSDHPKTVQTINNLAYVFQCQGHYAAARPLYEQALHITQATLGPQHPHTATSINNLAYVLQCLGDYAAARPLLEEALRIRQVALGSDHPQTAQSINNLAGLFESVHDYTSARPLYEQALHITEAALGPDHPDTATSINNLAYLFSSVDNYAAAHPLYEKALRIRQDALGPYHPDTAQSMNNLAYLLSKMDDHAAARPLYEKALNIYQTTLGLDHPTTQTTVQNLVALDAPPVETQIAQITMQAQSAMLQALASGSADDCEQQIGHFMELVEQIRISENKGSPWLPLADQLEVFAAHLRNPDPLDQPRAIVALAELEVKRALGNNNTKRRAMLINQLTEQADLFANGAEEGSVWMAVAEQLRALTDQLRTVG